MRVMRVAGAGANIKFLINLCRTALLTVECKDKMSQKHGRVDRQVIGRHIGTL